MNQEIESHTLLVIGNPTYFDRAKFARYFSLLGWPQDSNSLDHVTITHILEYLPVPERIEFINELWRVLKPGGKALVYLPYWSSPNAVSDPYLQWPPFTEMSLQYLVDAEFRQRNKIEYPELIADFYFNPPGYSYAPEWHIRSDQTREYMVKHSLSVVREMVCTITKRGSTDE